ncbi:MAG: heme-binding protein [Mycobacterium sp.]|jgi:hemophore-related protein|nr:heme-binding protein [Mycobacterium sp.]
MKLSAIAVRRGLFGAVTTAALGGVTVALIAAPTAGAADPCTASGLATTASGVLAEAGAYLDAHPEANTVLTTAATQPPEDAKAAVRGYFQGHVGEFLDLRRIAAPLKDLRNQCGIDISPTQFATLFQAMSE